MLHCNMKVVWQVSYAFGNLIWSGRAILAQLKRIHGAASPAAAKLLACCGQRLSAARPASVKP